MPHRHRRVPLAVRLLPIALAAALAGPPAAALVTLNGPYWTAPGGVVLNGLQQLLRPDVSVWMANAAPGSFAATAGSVVQLGSLSMGNNGGSATGLLSGAGTRLELHAGEGRVRLEIGNFGSGELTVAEGAVLDGRASAAACIQGGGWCNASIGSSAGSSGLLTVTDPGSMVSLMGGLHVGTIDTHGAGYGTPGAQTSGRIRVLNGGVLNTERTRLGVSDLGPLALGTERSVVQALVQGAGSVWTVGQDSVNGGTFMDLASGPRAQATLEVLAGGQMRLQAQPGGDYGLRIGFGGQASATVSGTDSLLALQGDADKGFFHIGEQGNAELHITAGAKVVGGRWNNVGFNGGHGLLTVTGAGSQALFQDGSLYAGFGSASQGTIQVLDGAQMHARSLLIGAGGATGSVYLSDAGSKIDISAVATSRLTVGDWGNGTLTVAGGAWIDGMADAAACAVAWCDSFVGSAAGSTARMTVTDKGSEVYLLGGLTIGGTAVNTQARDGWNYGIAGGSTQARVEVLAGGVLVTERVHVGGDPAVSGNGLESSKSQLLIDGPGSVWRVTGSTLAKQDAMVSSGKQPHGEADWQITAGGLLMIEAQAGRQALLRLAHGGGRSEMLVSGGGSLLRLAGAEASIHVGESGGWGRLRVADGAKVNLLGDNNSYINVAQGAGSSGALEILGGGRIEGARFVNIGAGGSGSLLIDGVGSLLATDRNGSFVGLLNVGQSGSGMLTVRNGGTASAFSLALGQTVGGGSGEVRIEGAGSRIELDALDWHRLNLHQGRLLVSQGAVLDGRVSEAACAGRWCGSFIANDAGDDVTLTVSGPGSRVSLLGMLYLATPSVGAPPLDSYSYGIPGGRSQARIEVLDGAWIQTEGVRMARGPAGTNPTGTESGHASVLLKGAGSVWDLRGGSDDGGNTNFFTGSGGGVNTRTDIQIRDGAQLRLRADASHSAWIQLGIDGGEHALLVSDTGSAIVYSDTGNAGLWIGRSGAQAGVQLLDGGQIQGINRIQVGNTGATGTLLVDGAGSAIGYGAAFADLFVGRQGGTGSASLLHGGRIDMQGSTFTRLYVGDGTGSNGASGNLHIAGGGSAMALQSPAFAAGSGWANPTGQIGWGGVGKLSIEDGGQLTLLGRGESTPTSISSTRLTIGQAINGVAGVGTVTVSGAGSLLSVLGADSIIYVGRSGGTGTLAVTGGGELRGTVLDIGAQLGTGTLQVQGGRVALSGQWSSSELGAIMAVGFGSSSVGTVHLGGGSLLTISNPGTAGAGLLLGGINQSPKGSGVLQVDGASRILIEGPAGNSAFIVGLGGSGLATFDGASRLSIGGGDVLVARDAEASGTLKLLGGSSLQAGYVGIGSTRGVDGGTAALIVNDASLLEAATLEVGTRGMVGGNGTLAADVINRGVFSPGNSPGTLTITGAFANQAGGRLLLEIEADGLGGFKTDQLVFADAAGVDLSGLAISFRFLGRTDPTAFQASGGFRIDDFFQLQSGGELAHEKFAGVSFNASAEAYLIENFSFTADGGAHFSATPVPEPGGWMLMLAGLGWFLLRRPRRCALRE